ncbi:MAG TPA: IPT/TIG domain-containing protein [Candidatus Peribacteraceae bacterium]|nr:IPT/TIG domain-containing protein [Candidatus Peribacteraceae bacterium]
MNIPSKLVIAGLMIGAIAMVQMASAMSSSLSVSSSVSSDTCGPNMFLCRLGSTPECVSGHWTCQPSVSSSSSQDLPCGPLTMLCIIGKVPQCSDGKWSCVTPSSSSSSSNSASSLPCGALNLLCMRNTTPQCSNGHWTCVPNQTRQRPSITSLNPISGPAGTQVTITGKNFTDTNDIVYFGNSKLDASSTDGTHITFTVPATFTIPCLQHPPYCKIATYMLKPGVYRVRVVTNGGLSNVKGFWLLGGSVSSSSSSSSVSSVVGDSCTCPAGQAWDATRKTCIADNGLMCPMYYVLGGWCGCDGKVYGNSCLGAAAGVKQGQNCSSISNPSSSSVH